VEDLVNDVMVDNQNEVNFAPSGLWEMYLADTRIELVQVADTYAWWKLTMIYPVYVHYEAVLESPELENYEDYSDLTIVDDDAHRRQRRRTGDIWWGDADNFEFHVASSKPTSAPTVAPDSSSSTDSDTTAYWVPIQERGTLDFISRLLQRVLQAAVVSGAFLSSLKELANLEVNDDPTDVVKHIIEVAIPGEEHLLDILIDVDDFEDDVNLDEAEAGSSSAGDGVKEKEPMEPLAPLGTYTHGLLDGNPDADESHHRHDDHHREQLGLSLLLFTLGGVVGIVTLATMRESLEKHAMQRQEAWMLGTEQDVAALLQVGWRHKEILIDRVQRMRNSGSDLENPAVVNSAEIFEVFDKSGAGYYEDDSMLHGSAMLQSFVGTESDGIPRSDRHVPSAPHQGWLA
jgi:hypothetical protein